METMEAAGRKREAQIGAEEAGTEKAAKIVEPVYPSAFERIQESAKKAELQMLRNLVARLNVENPNANPIVLEALTERERAALMREERARTRKIGLESLARMRAELEAKSESGVVPPPRKTDPNEDDDDLLYRRYREHWEHKWAKEFGTFESTTTIPSMYFTDIRMPDCTRHMNTLQMFSVKVATITGGLVWPIDVFGMIAVRDKLDNRRNIIFKRTRDNCQTLTGQGQSLVLTGPSRAALYAGSVRFDAMLKVKGTSESEDRDLTLLAKRYDCCTLSDEEGTAKSCVDSRQYTSKLSTLELTCGIVVRSVEATISVRIAEGSWPDGLSCQFTACTASISHMEILLLDSIDENVPVTADGLIKLSRNVVSVEKFGELIVSAKACRGGKHCAHSKVSFKPSDAGKSCNLVNVGSCILEVTVAWSLILVGYPMDGLPPTN